MPPAARELGVIISDRAAPEGRRQTYWFVSPPGAGDRIFVHQNEVRGGVRLFAGDTVEYSVIDEYRGDGWRQRAVEVVKVMSTPRPRPPPPRGHEPNQRQLRMEKLQAMSDAARRVDNAAGALHPPAARAPTKHTYGAPLFGAAAAQSQDSPQAYSRGVPSGYTISASGMVSGTVIRFFRDRIPAYGFIGCDETGSQIYVNAFNVLTPGRTLVAGDRVRFRIASNRNDDRFRAIDVRHIRHEAPSRAQDRCRPLRHGPVEDPSALGDRLAALRVTPKTPVGLAVRVTPDTPPKGLDAARASSLSDQRAERVIPDALTCSISLDIMQDPVMACDGHTYERAAIEAWLSASPTSPKTGEVLESTTLIPNHSVRQLIDAFHQAATDACGADETKAPS